MSPLSRSTSPRRIFVPFSSPVNIVAFSIKVAFVPTSYLSDSSLVKREGLGLALREAHLDKVCCRCIRDSESEALSWGLENVEVGMSIVRRMKVVTIEQKVTRNILLWKIEERKFEAGQSFDMVVVGVQNRITRLPHGSVLSSSK